MKHKEEAKGEVYRDLRIDRITSMSRWSWFYCGGWAVNSGSIDNEIKRRGESRTKPSERGRQRRTGGGGDGDGRMPPPSNGAGVVGLD